MGGWDGTRYYNDVWSSPDAVHWTRVAPLTAVTLNKVAGLIVSAGSVVAGQNRPSATLSDYFEGANASATLDFDKGPATGVFNDRLQLLDPK